jgi:ribosome biogenesis GTPase
MRATPNVPTAGPLEDGLVTSSRRRHYTVRLDAGESIECVLKGRDTTLACGDRVRVARVAGGGSIEAVLPRTTLLYRSDEFREKLIAANVTQVIGVVAPDITVDEELVNPAG